MPRTRIHRPKPIPTADFDAKFDAGEDISKHRNFSTVRAAPSDTTPQKVNVDFPAWVVAALDQEADRIGVPRQSLIKFWIVQRIERNLDSPATRGSVEN